MNQQDRGKEAKGGFLGTGKAAADRISELERTIEQIWEDTSICLGLLDGRHRLYRHEKKLAEARRRLAPARVAATLPQEGGARGEKISKGVFLYHSLLAPALLIHADGSMEVVSPTSGGFTLEQLEGILRGPVSSQAVGSFSLVINAEENPETGAPKEGVPRNELATLIGFVDDVGYDVYIAGTALLCPQRMIP